jgi:hypothetical protein
MMPTCLRARLIAAWFACAGLVVCVPATSVAQGSNDAAVRAVFDRAIRALNARDLRGWLATCATGASIIDEIPPHSWQGPQGCANWWTDFTEFARRNRLTDTGVMLETPLHVVIEARSAYLVIPAVYTFRQSGKAQRETGTFTVAERRTVQGWMISGWTWTKQ